MEWNKLRAGYALTGSFCTVDKALLAMKQLQEKGVDLYPIVSYSIATMDTRFGTAENTLNRLRQISGREPIKTIPEAEPVGPKLALDVMIIAPCTGNSIAKLTYAITDTAHITKCSNHSRNIVRIVPSQLADFIILLSSFSFIFLSILVKMLL